MFKKNAWTTVLNVQDIVHYSTLVSCSKVQHYCYEYQQQSDDDSVVIGRLVASRLQGDYSVCLDIPFSVVFNEFYSQLDLYVLCS